MDEKCGAKTSLNIIEAEKLDADFKFQIAREPGGENIKFCFSCGTCTAGCPVHVIDEKYNPRRIIRMVLLGMKEEVLKSNFIWLCSTCYTCHERCPQNVKITDVMNAIKNVAVKEGFMHPSYAAQIDLIAGTGKLYAIEDFDNKKREKMGLPKVDTKVEDVARIFDQTGLKKVKAASPDEEKK